jgi:hypothetical protein
MYWKISELIEDEGLNTQAKFDKWVEARKKEIKELAYENRDTIYKRELENEINNFDSVKKAYKHIKSLRKKSDVYDVLMSIDKKGYITFRVYFPITEKELDECIEYRSTRVKALGRWGSSCISPEEACWSVLHERIYKKLDWANPYTSMQYFEKVNSGLVRKMEVFSFQ